MNRSANRYCILGSTAEVSHVAARHIESAAAQGIERHGQFTLVLAGGSSPIPVYELVFQRGRINWDRVHVFWSDERCVPPDHADSNYRTASATLFTRKAPPDDHLHRMMAEQGAQSAAAHYDQELATFFDAPQPASMTRSAFDLVLLGMGADGHTASLFPGGLALSSSAWAAPAHAPAGVKSSERVTLTLAAIAAAAEVCFIVMGSNKRDMVTRVLTDARADLPAARVTARGRVRWLLDRDAGANLPG